MEETKYHVELSFQTERMLTPKINKFEINKKRHNDLLSQFKKYSSYKKVEWGDNMAIDMKKINTDQETINKIKNKLDNIIDNKEIEKFTRNMMEKYKEKLPIYGKSWKIMDKEILRNRLLQEIEEYKQSTRNSINECDELIDIANICMMLWIRNLNDILK